MAAGSGLGTRLAVAVLRSCSDSIASLDASSVSNAADHGIMGSTMVVTKGSVKAVKRHHNGRFVRRSSKKFAILDVDSSVQPCQTFTLRINVPRRDSLTHYDCTITTAN